ncbi:MAG: PEGA domain-containing protein [Deltaproteobacteria bacterium]|nr:MAG: PEGA domain-containing protein [Deltaproteobacteria bacterium]
MNVPEPPPIPGILDRFTPAPTRRTSDREVGPDAKSAKPDFVPTPPGGAAPPEVRSPTSPSSAPASAPGPSPSGPKADSSGPFWQDPLFLAVTGAAVLLAVFVLAGLILFLAIPSSAPPTSQEPATVSPAVPQVVRPGLTEEVPDVDEADESDEAEALPEEGADEPEGEATPEPAAAASKPAPVRQPVRRAAPAADTPGTLKVRATRATLVYVNGVPVGMAPVDVERPPGAYTIHIVDKGKRKEQRVDLTAGAVRNVEF